MGLAGSRVVGHRLLPAEVQVVHSDEAVAHVCNLVVRIEVQAVAAVLPMAVHPLV